MTDGIGFSDVKVEADPEKYGAAEINAYSAKISHDREGRSALEIAADELGYDGKGDKPEDYLEVVRENTEGFLEKLAELNHTSCFYQQNTGANLEVPRQTTMFLCQFDHPKYLQQSQRYTEADEFISGIDDERVEKLYSDAKQLYNEMISDDGDKIRKEDARYVLPLATSATHIHTNLNLVSFSNIYRVAKEEGVPEVTERSVEKLLEELEKKEPVVFNQEMVDVFSKDKIHYPVTNMFSETNRGLEEIGSPGSEPVRVFEKEIDFTDDGYSRDFLNLFDRHLPVESKKGFVTSMSLSAWHQFMRNDTVKQSVQSIYDAAEEGRTVVPEDISGSEYSERYEKLCRDSLALYDQLREDYGDDAVEVVPHALEVDVAFNGGSEVIEKFVENRASEAAQWEIREIAQAVERMVGD